jgi:hypothetical protein
MLLSSLPLRIRLRHENVRITMNRSIAVLAVAAALSGCFSYKPIGTGVEPKTGERVRVELTSEGTTELARYLGPRVKEAEGALISVAADRAWVVAVDFVALVDGIRQPWSGEGHVTFPAQYIAGTRGRVMEKRRSWVAAVAAAGALILTAVVALKQSQAGTGIEPPPPPPG